MKNIPKLPKIAIVALLAGLLIGLGAGHLQLKKEERAFQDKIKEAIKKIAFIQRKLTEEKNEAAFSVEQKCQEDRNNLETLQKEKTSLAGKLKQIEAETQKLEKKTKDADEASARTIKELERNNKNLDSELKKTAGEKQTLVAELKKTAGEKQALETELKKTTQSLGHCESNNAELCIIAGELINKYRDKGLGTILMTKEPLTQIKQVELEHFIQKYQEEIEQQKIKKKAM